MTEAYIRHIAYYLPPTTLTNEALSQRFPEWSAEKVAAKVGISERHVARPDETATDLACAAAERLFAESGVAREAIDFVLLCTQSPDYRLPTSACLVQERLGLPTRVGALDFNLGCSGYVYGLSLAQGLIASGAARNVLLLTAETYTKYIHPDDKGNLSLFGDGAAATLVSIEGFARIGAFVFGTDGSGADKLIVRTGGARTPAAQGEVSHDEGGYLLSADHLYMSGSDIFNFTLTTVPPLLAEVLQRNALSQGDIAQYVLHQANRFMLTTLRKVCGIPRERFYIDLERTGNTVSSTLPIALRDARAKGLLPAGGHVVIAGFGVGLSYGGCVLHF